MGSDCERGAKERARAEKEAPGANELRNRLEASPPSPLSHSTSPSSTTTRRRRSGVEKHLTRTRFVFKVASRTYRAGSVGGASDGAGHDASSADDLTVAQLEDVRDAAGDVVRAAKDRLKLQRGAEIVDLQGTLQQQANKNVSSSPASVSI